MFTLIDSFEYTSFLKDVAFNQIFVIAGLMIFAAVIVIPIICYIIDQRSK